MLWRIERNFFVHCEPLYAPNIFHDSLFVLRTPSSLAYRIMSTKQSCTSSSDVLQLRASVTTGKHSVIFGIQKRLLQENCRCAQISVRTKSWMSEKVRAEKFVAIYGELGETFPTRYFSGHKTVFAKKRTQFITNANPGL